MFTVSGKLESGQTFRASSSQETPIDALADVMTALNGNSGFVASVTMKRAQPVTLKLGAAPIVAAKRGRPAKRTRGRK